MTKPIHEKNIETIAELRNASQQRVNRHQRALEAVSRSIGRPATVYALLGVVVGWATYNAAAPRLGWIQLDAPPFFCLQGAVALFGALVATTVLTAQNRLTLESERRAHLELQVSLLAEQKVTKIIALLEELRRDLPIVRDRHDPVADALQEQADPRAVLSALESTMESVLAADVHGKDEPEK
jgi:uncharacterized membrane protein